LRTLSVFAGGFSLEAAEAVCDQDDPLESLAALVEKSLVVFDPDTSRYRLLETIRAFAGARCEESGEEHAVAVAHLAWCVAFAEPLSGIAMTLRQPDAFAMFDREVDNLRAALAWAEEQKESGGLRLVGLLGEYWSRRAPLEGRRWCRRLLDAVPNGRPLDVGRALETGAYCAVWIGHDLEQAEEEADRAVEVLEEAGDMRALLYARLHRAWHTEVRGDLEACRAEHLKLHEMAAKAGDRFIEAVAINNLASAELHLGGDPSSAHSLAEEALSIMNEVDAPLTGHVVAKLNLARSSHETCSPISAVLGHVADALDDIAELRVPIYLAGGLAYISEYIARADPERAARLIGASMGLLNDHGVVITSDRHIDRVRTELEQLLGTNRAKVLFESTNHLGFDEALDLAREAVGTYQTLPC
jgi:hypothetical protein